MLYASLAHKSPKDASPVGLVSPAAPSRSWVQNVGWGEFQARSNYPPRCSSQGFGRGGGLVFSVGDSKSSPVESGPACGPCLCVLRAARPRSSRRLIPWGRSVPHWPSFFLADKWKTKVKKNHAVHVNFYYIAGVLVHIHIRLIIGRP